MPTFQQVFPAEILDCPAQAETSLELRALLASVDGKTWKEAPRELIRRYPLLLELLPSRLYVKLLPAWLEQAVVEPDGNVARWVLQHLQRTPVLALSAAERQAVLGVAYSLVFRSLEGASSVEGVKVWNNIKRHWQGAA